MVEQKQAELDEAESAHVQGEENAIREANDLAEKNAAIEAEKERLVAGAKRAV